jgi:hypothetical protein
LGKSRLQVFDNDGNFLRALGRHAKEEREFDGPICVFINKDELIYVRFQDHRVQVFDREGTFVRAFGRPGKAAGELQNPSEIAGDPFGHLYVVDYNNHRIQIFDGIGAWEL